MPLKPPKELIKINDVNSFYKNCSGFIPSELRKKIDGAIDANDLVNFLNHFAELNMAAILHSKKIDFQYEPQKGIDIDFVFSDYAISFKNLTEKGYRQNEKKELQENLAKTNNERVSLIKPYPNTNVELELSRDGADGRIETGSVSYGEPPFSEMKEKGKILEDMAKLEDIDASVKKKVLFLFGQSDEVDSGFVDDCCRYYFNCALSGGDPTGKLNYDKWFKKLKNNSINSIIYAEPNVDGISSLVWYNGVKPKVWTKDENSRKFFIDLFSPASLA